jgi:hypothetical protein
LEVKTTQKRKSGKLDFACRAFYAILDIFIAKTRGCCRTYSIKTRKPKKILYNALYAILHFSDLCFCSVLRIFAVFVPAFTGVF